MRLAQPDPAVEEQRVVGLGRSVGDCPAGRVGEAGVVADHEVLELEPGIQLRGVVRARLLRRLLGHRPRRLQGSQRRFRGLRHHLEGHLDVTRNDRRERFLDDRRVAVLEPVLGQLGGDADAKGVALPAHQRGVLEPGLVARLAELEAQFFLRRLPYLFRVHSAPPFHDTNCVRLESGARSWGGIADSATVGNGGPGRSLVAVTYAQASHKKWRTGSRSPQPRVYKLWVDEPQLSGAAES